MERESEFLNSRRITPEAFTGELYLKCTCPSVESKLLNPFKLDVSLFGTFSESSEFLAVYLWYKLVHIQDKPFLLVIT